MLRHLFESAQSQQVDAPSSLKEEIFHSTGLSFPEFLATIEVRFEEAIDRKIPKEAIILGDMPTISFN